jgi:basic amino acid/polyamine antiporter, APA family
MVNAEMVAGAARDGLFPAGLERRTRGLPVLALLINSTLATVLLVVNATGDALDLFTTLALLSTFIYVFGYILSVAAQLLYVVTRGGAIPWREAAVALLALAFSIWMAGATGADAVQAGTVMLLLGIPAYVLSRGLAAHRGRRAR